MADMSWGALNEAKTKKKTLKKEASLPPKKNTKKDEPEMEDVPDAPKEPDAPKNDMPDLPSLGDEKSGMPPEKHGEPDGVESHDDAPSEPEEATPEDSEEAQADAAEAKAELEKAKAEKDRAEKEIKQQSYIKLGSQSGTQYLLGKVLDHAFKTNTIDALAGEMVQKLKIQTPEDMNAFGEDTAAFRVIPGMPELLTAMKPLATKQPDSEPEAEEDSVG